MQYDALGRLMKVWLANSAKSGGHPPNLEYTYLVAKDTAAAVQTKALNTTGGQVTTGYQIYDGFLRPRQSQEPAADGSRLISDTFYNALGKTARTYAAYAAGGAPSRDPLRHRHARGHRDPDRLRL